MILDFFVFCDAWCWLTFVTPSQGWLFQQKPPAKGSSCSEVVSWRGAQGTLGLHPSHILFCLLLAALTGQKETSGNTEALPLPSYSCSHPSHHSKWSFNLTDRCVWGVKWCWEAHKDQTCFAGHRGAGVMVPNFSGFVRPSSQDLYDTKRMWEAGMGFQQKVASYLAEFFPWVTFWGVINPWAMHAQMGFAV